MNLIDLKPEIIGRMAECQVEGKRRLVKIIDIVRREGIGAHAGVKVIWDIGGKPVEFLQPLRDHNEGSLRFLTLIPNHQTTPL